MVCFFYSSTMAQTKNTFEFGADIGYNSSYVSLSQFSYNSKNVDGFNLGIAADYYFSEKWSIKTKFTYDQKGWGNGYFYGPGGEQLDNINLELNYLTIPLLADFHFGKTKNWFFDVGPYVGFLLSAGDKYDRFNLKSSFNSTDAGLDAGAGLNYPLTPKLKLFIEAEAQYGLANIYKNKPNDAFLNIRTSLNIGVNFPLSGLPLQLLDRW